MPVKTNGVWRWAKDHFSMTWGRPEFIASGHRYYGLARSLPRERESKPDAKNERKGTQPHSVHAA